jgi:hypothetical protein
MTDGKNAHPLRRRSHRMRRRELLLLLGGAMTVPRALRAQQKAKQVIGFLSGFSPLKTLASWAEARSFRD